MRVKGLFFVSVMKVAKFNVFGAAERGDEGDEVGRRR